MNETNTMYHAVPEISELNRVKGFDPTRFLRKTKDGPKLDLKVKKLWFRMKYPNGRIKLSALKITDQLAIIEARVYLDKNDTNYVSSFTAQTYKDSSPGGLYVELAQHHAEDEALSSAGFGIQFASVNTANTPNVSAPQTDATPTVKVEEKIEIKPKEKITPVAEQAPQPVAKATEEISKPQPEVIITPQTSEATTAQPVAEAPAKVATAPVVETPVQEVTEIREEDTSLPYNKSMSVEEICAIMTNEEAKNYIAPVGSCKGWTLGQVAERRRPSLKWYVSGYTGDDNVLRAAATIVLKLTENQAA